MTIARRLLILLAVPLVILVGLGTFVGLQLTRIDAQSKFLANLQIPSLAVLANIARSTSELRINLRSYMLATDPVQRDRARTLYDADKAELGVLLNRYEASLITDAQDKLLLTRYRRHSGSLTRAAYLSARNDAFGNLGIIAAGIVTAATSSRWPDLIVGLAIFVMNLDAAHDVLRAARKEGAIVPPS